MEAKYAYFDSFFWFFFFKEKGKGKRKKGKDLRREITVSNSRRL